jgi:hypothetical protein
MRLPESIIRFSISSRVRHLGGDLHSVRRTGWLKTTTLVAEFGHPTCNAFTFPPSASTRKLAHGQAPFAATLNLVATREKRLMHLSSILKMVRVRRLINWLTQT